MPFLAGRLRPDRIARIPRALRVAPEQIENENDDEDDC